MGLAHWCSSNRSQRLFVSTHTFIFCSHDYSFSWINFKYKHKPYSVQQHIFVEKQITSHIKFAPSISGLFSFQNQKIKWKKWLKQESNERCTGTHAAKCLGAAEHQSKHFIEWVKRNVYFNYWLLYFNNREYCMGTWEYLRFSKRRRRRRERSFKFSNSSVDLLSNITSFDLSLVQKLQYNCTHSVYINCISLVFSLQTCIYSIKENATLNKAYHTIYIWLLNLVVFIPVCVFVFIPNGCLSWVKHIDFINFLIAKKTGLFRTCRERSWKVIRVRILLTLI